MSRSQSSQRGAPRGNQNARRHGYYSRAARSHPEAVDSGGGAHAAGSPPEGEVGSPASPSARISSRTEANTDGGGPSLVPSLDDLILELYAKQQDLAAYISTLRRTESDDARVLSALELFRQNTSTLGRLLHYRGQGDRDRELTGALNEALDLLSKDLGVRL